MPRTLPRFLFLVSCFLFVLAPALWACSVPVFRYALERWEPDPYELVVFHKGALNPSQQMLVDELARASAAPLSANLTVQTVDVGEPLTEDMKKLLAAETPRELPWLVARYPGSPDKAYAGPLSRETVQGLVDSPLRREVQKRILGGESAVFVLLESGQRDKDDAAAARLGRRLKQLEGELKLPEAADEIARAILENKNAPELKIAFSMVRLSRQDAAEKVFVEVLVNTEADLRKYDEPMVFPIFGRGRVFDALVGKGITDENIRDVCAFIIGPCSCEVKRINPGRDLIMAVDWSKTIGAPPPRTTAGRKSPEVSAPVTTHLAAPLAGREPHPPDRGTPISAPSIDDETLDTVSDDGSRAIRNGLLILGALVGLSMFVLFRR